VSGQIAQKAATDPSHRLAKGLLVGVAKGRDMPLFLIERQFAESLQIDAASVAAVKLINDDVGVNWLFSFLSADRKKTYCLYEAPNADAIRIAARIANLPADVVLEVSQIRPESFL
jgi:hypothetical protein